MALEYAQENIWFDKWRYDEAETKYYEKKSVGTTCLGTLANQIAKAREEIQNSLASGNKTAASNPAPPANVNADVVNRITKLEGENQSLKKTVSSLENTILELTKRMNALECGAKPTVTATTGSGPSLKQETKAQEEEDDDDVDLFGSDEEEDEEANRVREERLKAYAEKKAKKPGPIAKSSVLLDCKPWDDETDMAKMEEVVRQIEMEGLVWGASKLVPLAFGIKKLSILCTVEDEKVSIDDLIEKITENEDYVQSVDIGAFNKI